MYARTTFSISVNVQIKSESATKAMTKLKSFLIEDFLSDWKTKYPFPIKQGSVKTENEIHANSADCSNSLRSDSKLWSNWSAFGIEMVFDTNSIFDGSFRFQSKLEISSFFYSIGINFERLNMKEKLSMNLILFKIPSKYLKTEKSS